jgi:hypothetical protein
MASTGPAANSPSSGISADVRGHLDGPGGASVPAPVRLFAEGPGSADLASTEKVQDGTILSGQDHTDLTTDDTVFSFGGKGR